MQLQIENTESDWADIKVDGKFTIHVKRNDVGWSLDLLNSNGDLLDGHEYQLWDEDLDEDPEDGED